MRSTCRRIIVAAGLAARAASAQMPAPLAPVLPGIDTTRVHPAHLVYRLALVTAEQSRPLGDLIVDVAPTTYGGTGAWLLTRTPTQPDAGPAESLFVSRSTLRPFHWTAMLRLARLAVEFTPDTAFGAMSSPLGHRDIVLASRSGLVPNADALDALLAALPLRAGFADSLAVVAIDPGGGATGSASLVVEGQEKVSVPAGSFDAWVVRLESERGETRLWVSVRGQTVVRSEQVLPQLGGAVLVRVLVSGGR